MPAEEPYGRNVHVRFWRGPGVGNGPGLLNHIMAHHAAQGHFAAGILTEHFLQVGLLVLSGGFVGILADLERRGRTERDRVTRLFGRYTAPEVVELLLEHPEVADIEPRRRSITVLFADLRGFTQLSENLPAQDVVEILDEFYGAAVGAVIESQGTIDKFVGDQVMALFDFPVERGDGSLRAVEAARRLLEAFSVLQERWRARQEPGTSIGLGVGVNSGEAVVGTIGSTARADFTAIGDTVNTAARLCAAANHGEILIGARTALLLDEMGRRDMLTPGTCRPIVVKGKSSPLGARVLRVDRGEAELSLARSRRRQD